MIRTFGILALSFFLFDTVQGQAVLPSKVLKKFELIVGPSFSKNTGYLSNYELMTGYSIGIGYDQPFSKSFSINMRALLERKGSIATHSYGLTSGNTNTDVTDTYTTKFNYLSLYAIPTFHAWNNNITLGVGGYYSLLQKLSVNVYSEDSNTGEFISEYSETRKDYFSPSYDAGITFQLGYSFNVSEKNRLILQAFTNLGLVDLYNPTIGSQRNKTFGLLVSFRVR